MEHSPSQAQTVNPAVARFSGAASEVRRNSAVRARVRGFPRRTGVLEDGDAAARAVQVVELAQRDPDAGLSLLHERFAGMVNRLVWRLLGTDPDHDDLVQQVFFAMFTSLGQLRDPAKLDVWVRTVTVNSVRQELRRRTVRRFFWNEQKHVARVGDLATEVESRDLLAQCKDVLDKIPSSQRLVFVLHFVEGHSLKDVAEMCGYSHITAKRRLQAASGRFRALAERRPDLLKRLGALASS